MAPGDGARRGRRIASPVVRVAILEGADSGWRGEAVADHIGVVLADGREFWCGDDLHWMLLVEADADELALLAAAKNEPG